MADSAALQDSAAQQDTDSAASSPACTPAASDAETLPTSDAEPDFVCVKHAAYGELGTCPLRATPRIVSLPPGADHATLLEILKSPKAARAVSMPATAHVRTCTEGSSFALDDDDSVVFVCNASTEHASARFLDSMTEGAAPPARPIPALHGPSSLPYARCPSGAEGTLINESDNVAGVIWGLDTEQQPPARKSAPPPLGAKAIPIKAPPLPPPQVKSSVLNHDNTAAHVIYQVGAAPMARDAAARFNIPPAAPQAYSFPMHQAFSDRKPTLVSPNMYGSAYSPVPHFQPPMNYTMPSPMPHHNATQSVPVKPVAPTTARAKVRSFDHGPLNLEEIRHELALERLCAAGMPFTPTQNLQLPTINLAPQALPVVPSIQQYPVIGQRTESSMYQPAPAPPSPYTPMHTYPPMPSLSSSPAFSTASSSSPNDFLATPATTFAPIAEFLLPDDPVIAKVGHDELSPLQYSVPLLAPPRDGRQLRIVSDPYVHASLHKAPLATAASKPALKPAARPRIASCDDEVINLAHLRRPSDNSDTAVQPIGFQRSPSVPSPVVPAVPAPARAAVGKPALGPYRAPRSVPMAKLMLRRLPSMPSLAEEATPPATPTTARGVGLGFSTEAEAQAAPAPETPRARRVVSESAVPLGSPKAPLMRARGPSVDGSKGFGARRAVGAPSPPSPLRQVQAVAEEAAPLPALKLEKHVSIADGTPRRRGVRGGARKLRDATPHPVKKTVSRPAPVSSTPMKDGRERRGPAKEGRRARASRMPVKVMKVVAA